jgi:hypothetical protein
MTFIYFFGIDNTVIEVKVLEGSNPYSCTVGNITIVGGGHIPTYRDYNPSYYMFLIPSTAPPKYMVVMFR